jgi:hypothetical protein
MDEKILRELLDDCETQNLCLADHNEFLVEFLNRLIPWVGARLKKPGDPEWRKLLEEAETLGLDH